MPTYLYRAYNGEELALEKQPGERVPGVVRRPVLGVRWDPENLAPEWLEAMDFDAQPTAAELEAWFRAREEAYEGLNFWQQPPPMFAVRRYERV